MIRRGPVRRRALHAAPTRSGWRRAPLLIAVAAVVLGTGLGTAWAFVTASGSGTKTGRIATVVTVTVSAATATTTLLPGGEGPAYFTLKNTNSIAVTFTKVTAASAVSNTTTKCPTANISIAQTLPYTLSPTLTVAANSTSATKSIANFVKLATTAPTGCQGVTFAVSLTLTGK